MKLLRLTGIVFISICIYCLLFPSALSYNFDFSRFIDAEEKLHISNLDHTYRSINPQTREWKTLRNWFSEHTEDWKKLDLEELRLDPIAIEGEKIRMRFSNNGSHVYVRVKAKNPEVYFGHAIESGEFGFLRSAILSQPPGSRNP